VKDHLHCLIPRKKKKILRRYVNLRQLQGYRISEGNVVEEGLDLLDLDERCKIEEEKLKRMLERVS